MEIKCPYQIVIIDETELNSYNNLTDNFKEENIKLKSNSIDVFEYLKENLNKKTVIVVNYGFTNNNNLEIIEKLKNLSTLLYLILYIDEEITQLSKEDLKLIVNNNVKAIVFKPESIVEAIKQGFNELRRNIDTCIEEWIISLEKQERIVKSIKSSKNSWSLDDILYEIRHRTAEGIEFENNIITLTLDLIHRGRRKLKEEKLALDMTSLISSKKVALFYDGETFPEIINIEEKDLLNLSIEIDFYKNENSQLNWRYRVKGEDKYLCKDFGIITDPLKGSIKEIIKKRLKQKNTPEYTIDNLINEYFTENKTIWK